jgi:pimeloyl-ACP methyl ester carboxylesterase
MGPADGQRVVLVPGMTGSKEDFVLMMPLLADAGYRVESFDMAGQYESHAAGPENLAPPGGRYTLELFCDDLVAALESGPTPAHLLGYSFAGTVAEAVTVAHPELVASLTLLSAPPVAGQALRAFKLLGPYSGAIGADALGRLFVWALRHNVHRARRDRATFVTARFALTRRSSVGDMLALMKQTPDLAAAVRATGIPVLVVIGTGDVWPLDVHRTFARELGARLVVLPTGHSPCETAPHQVTQAMRDLFET